MFASLAVHDLQSELQSWLRGSAGLGWVFRSQKEAWSGAGFYLRGEERT